jgi:cysteine desulfurase
MLPYLREHFGNPSSAHERGHRANAAVETARRQVAELLGAEPGEIVFTGGGSEASNLAIKGVVFPLLEATHKGDRRPPHIITSAIEHPATLQPCRFLERLGCLVTVLPVDRYGVVNLNDLEATLRQNAPTELVSVMHANNEVATHQSMREIARHAHLHHALVHTDAAQSVGKLPVNVRDLDVDLLTVAGHKLYAPKGVGALFVRQGIKLEPLIHGAGHEAGRRAGTENVPYDVALGAACELARRSLPDATERLGFLRDRLWAQLERGLGTRVKLNGFPGGANRLPNTLNVCFLGHTGADLLRAVPEIAASTGSACHEGTVKLSPVLAAMGVHPEVGRGAVRLSVGRYTREEEVDRAAALLIAAASKT